MKFFSTWLLASVFLTFSVTGLSADTNYRPYISTNLAKAIMTDKEEVIQEKCDGSGWITHGDGHKTECPGCSACQGNNPKPDPEPEKPEVTYRCKCDSGKTYCNCVAAYGKCGCKKTIVKKKDGSRDSRSSGDSSAKLGFLQRTREFFRRIKYYIYHRP